MSSLKKLIMMANQGSDSSSLPSHLEMAEYLEATGTQYIDLGYPLGYENKVVVDVWGNNHTSSAFTFGNTRVATARIGGDIGNRNGNHYFGNQTFAKNIYQNKRMNITYSKDGVGVDDVLYPWSATPTDFTTDGNIFLCALNTSNGANYYYQGKIYSCQIYDHDVLIHDYIPCFNTENRRPCIYDTITGIELYNQGTGEFNYHIEGKAIPYLAFEALEDDLQVSITKSVTQYSLDRVTWIDLPAEEQTPPIAKGEKVWFRANITPDGTNTGIGTFSCTKNCNLEGTPMSLLYGDRAGDVLSLPSKAYCFAYLFAYNDKIIRVNNPMSFLPAMFFQATYCYYAMFTYNINLQNSVYLPCLRLSGYCYANMYNRCISLVEVFDFPEWKNTGSVNGACNSTFRECLYLKKQPYIPNNSYIDCSYMFYGCISMEVSQEYIHKFNEYMYYDCKSLKTAPKLYHKSGRYIRYCFTNNYSLTTPPPTIELSEMYTSGLEYIFSGCFNMEESPIIIADSYNDAQSYACRHAFNGCRKLKYITFLPLPAPDSATQYMYNWVSNVAPKGTIVLNKNIEWNPEDYRGVNGIPVGWKVKYCDPDNLDDIRDYREIDKAWDE